MRTIVEPEILITKFIIRVHERICCRDDMPGLCIRSFSMIMIKSRNISYVAAWTSEEQEQDGAGATYVVDTCNKYHKRRGFSCMVSIDAEIGECLVQVS